jgi:membrane-associated protein
VTDWLLSLVPEYGLWLLGLATFASCLAVPLPTSTLLLAAGGFVAVGDLSLVSVAVVALGGAVAGDQVGYFGARWFGAPLIDTLGKRAPPLARATDLLAKRGGAAVFFSRWLMSALGPYVNLAAGAAGQPWPRFTIWGVLGEVVWVGIYLGLGYSFIGNLEAASDIAVSWLGFVTAGAIALGLGAWLSATLRADRGRSQPN